MKGLERLAVAAVLFVVGIAALIYFGFPTYTHRFRLTFEIEDNGQTKVGSGVITVEDTDYDWFPLMQGRWRRRVRGPSPWVELGDRGIVLAAMRPLAHINYKPLPYLAGDLSFVAYFGASHGSPLIDDVTVRKISRESGRKDLRRDQLPEFIWLPNPLDPASARAVPPDQFESIIGPGVRLGAVSVEITDSHPDDSLYARLPWLREMQTQEFTPGGPSPRYKLKALNIVGDP